ncbi:MAG: Flp family type IVb pilin [Hyphomicrobiales bacterium]|nr:MAG: Flp family type IVb pilin [Hyphomicrobiales bacterium]
MTVLAQRFMIDDSGATAIEYGLIAALVAVGCIAAMTALGGNLLGLFGWVRDRAGGAMDGAGI